MTKIEQLVKEFRQNVIAQTDAIGKGDHKTGNRFAKQYIKNFEDLRKYGNEGRDALCLLLDDERTDVRVMSAAYLLRYRNTEATAVLREIAKSQGLAAFEASEALKRWEEGNWSLDPEQTQ